jgi:predicted Rossmann fold nucleotide-binding protein DprA/Smf involved in DNA uptake
LTVEVIHLEPTDPRYPARLRDQASPPSVTALGNLELLEVTPWLAVFCSSSCPGSLILKAHDTAKALVAQGAAVIGGFHSPIEREMQRVLLRGSNPLIVCPARGLARMRIPVQQARALEESRLLFLSAFPDSVSRSSEEMAQRRNRFVIAMTDQTLIVHAASGSATAKLAQQVLAQRQALFVLEDDHNAALVQAGAKTWPPALT